jgi:class 3 adenylate cyclase/tetratricopeptide (TPR) repeat protein
VTAPATPRSLDVSDAAPELIGAGCPDCGFANLPRARFCSGCGKKLDGVRAEAQTARVIAPSPARGERKRATVLFADIVGSTAMIDGIDLEQARRKLQPAVAAMIQAVHQFGGTVTRVVGDGVKAVFGAPAALEDHAVAACDSALAMLDLVSEAAGPQVAIRIGLHSGAILAEPPDRRIERGFDVSGFTAHLAARMEQLAEPGTILITAATRSQIADHFETMPLGPKLVKGAREPVEVHRLAARAGTRTRWEARLAAHGVTAFVGRKAELRRMLAALGRAEAGEGRIVTLVGEPGVGKSRLLHEFLATPPAARWRRLRAGVVSARYVWPYMAAATLLRAWLGEPGDAVLEGAALPARLAALGADADKLLPSLRMLLGLPAGDEAWEAQDPATRRRRIAVDFTAFVMAASRAECLMIVVEDVHWIDSESRDILDQLAASCASARLLLVTTSRQEPSGPWCGTQADVTVALRPLDRTRTVALARNLLGGDPSVAGLAKLVTERCAGVPLFLEEAVGALAASGAIAGEPGRYRLARPLGEIAIPETVHGVIAARIDQLPAAEKVLLGIASALGMTFPLDQLRDLAGLAGHRLRRSVAALRAADVLRPVGPVRDATLAFRHALIHDVVYEGLLHEDRRALHGRILALLEASAQPDRHVDILAHHALAAELWRPAARHLLVAGTQALQRGDADRALHCSEQGLGALTYLPTDADTLADAFELRICRHQALVSTANLTLVLENLQDAERLAGALADERRLALVHYSQAVAMANRGKLDHVIEAGWRAFDLARRLGDRAMTTGARILLGLAFFNAGRVDRVVELLEPDVPLMLGEFRHSRVVPTFGNAAMVYLTLLSAAQARLGQFAAAMATAEAARQIAEETGRALYLIFGARYVAVVHLARGDGSAALDVLMPWYNMALQERFIAPMFQRNVGVAHLLRGDPTAARAVLEDAVRSARSWQHEFGEVSGLICLGWARLGEGAPAPAADVASEALEASRARGYEALEGEALRLRAVARARQEAPDLAAARQDAEAALAVFERLGIEPEQAASELALGEVLARMGLRSEARAMFRSAINRHRRLGIIGWVGAPPERAARWWRR